MTQGIVVYLGGFEFISMMLSIIEAISQSSVPAMVSVVFRVTHIII